MIRMKKPSLGLSLISIEILLYWLAFSLALAMRLANLGAAPLSDTEASAALQALQLTFNNTGSNSPGWPQPAYVVPTGLLFMLFGDSNFAARFWPAFSGAWLVFLPWMISRQDRPRLLNRQTALIMAFILAFSPGLLISGRLALATMMALTFGLLAAGSLFLQKPILSGILFGIALLSGPAAIQGLIIGGLAWLTAWYFSYARSSQPSMLSGMVDWRKLGVATALTVLLLATLLLRMPGGLASFLNTLPAFLQSWFGLSEIPALRVLAALLIYQPVVFVFGFIGIVRGLFSRNEQESVENWQSAVTVIPDPEAGRFSFLLGFTWVIIGLVVILANPGRQVSDLVWILPPMAGLAAWEISHYLPGKNINWSSITLALLLLVMMGLLWYTLASITRLPPDSQERMVRYFVILGILALSALSVILVWMGWSGSAARNGLVWGILSSLVLFSIAGLWGATYAPRWGSIATNQPQDLWSPNPAPGAADLIALTLRDLSLYDTGRVDRIDIISQVDRPSLQWLLRDFSRARFSENWQSNSSTSLPAVLITSLDQQTPELNAAYRGQDFVWAVRPGWQGALPTDLVAWLVFRLAPLENERLILWARSDVFPGGILEIQPAAIEESQNDQPALDPNSDLMDDIRNLNEDQNILP